MKGEIIMNGIETLLIVLAVLAFLSIIVGIVIPLLKRKGVDVDGILGQTKQALSILTEVMNTLRPFLTGVKGVDIVDKIIEASKIGVGNAEQLWHIGKLEAGERNAAAKDYVYEALKFIGVERTPEIELLVDGAIEQCVLELGHSKG